MSGWVWTTLVLAALQAAPGGSSSASEQVRRVEEGVNAAYAANDLPRYFSYYAPGLTQWWPTGRVDLPAYRKQWEAFVGGGGRVLAARMSDLVVQVSPGADAAVASYRLHVETRDEHGTVTTDELQETDVLFRRDGAWRIVHLHYSLAPRPEP
jgi:ketosteroid isomerase-like protein